MADEPDNIVLEHLRAIRNTLADLQAEMRAEFHDLKVRMTGVEQGLAVLNNRVDRIEVRLQKIDKRLDLTEA
jgi:predicted  nucleic acid-binding Zn-ribbon protein